MVMPSPHAPNKLAFGFNLPEHETKVTVASAGEKKEEVELLLKREPIQTHAAEAGGTAAAHRHHHRHQPTLQLGEWDIEVRPDPVPRPQVLLSLL